MSWRLAERAGSGKAAIAAGPANAIKVAEGISDLTVALNVFLQLIFRSSREVPQGHGVRIGLSRDGSVVQMAAAGAAAQGAGACGCGVVRRRIALSLAERPFDLAASFQLALRTTPCPGPSHYFAATANNALGLVRAIVSNVLAAPLGCFLPCSYP